MLDHFNMFAKYNDWANRRLYAAVENLSDDDYRKDCKVAFNSMHGTLNHILAGDMIWLSRFMGTTGAPNVLDGILHEEFNDLRVSRQDLDEQIIDYIAGLDTETLAGNFSYTPITTPEKVTQQLSSALAHIFNHQTHHRGQAHAILTRLIGEAPPLDLIYYQRDVRMGIV